MRGGQRHDMLTGSAMALSHPDTHRGVWVDQHAMAVVDLADDRQGLRVVNTVTGEGGCQALMLRRGERGTAMVAEPGDQLGGGCTVAVKQFIQQALEVRGDLNVHARRQGRHDLGGAHLPRLDEAREDVVAVRCDQESVDVQAHPRRHMAREDVAEVAGGNTERGCLRATSESLDRPHVVDDLHHHPCPVDRIDRSQTVPLAEGFVNEHRLHQVLAVVERSLDRHSMHVGVFQGGHLAALDLGGPAVGEQHHGLDVFGAAHRLHCG